MPPSPPSEILTFLEWPRPEEEEPPWPRIFVFGREVLDRLREGRLFEQPARLERPVPPRRQP